MCNNTSIKRTILTIKKIYREVGRAKDLSAPLYKLAGRKNSGRPLESPLGC